jgi:hypothetical protein
MRPGRYEQAAAADAGSPSPTPARPLSHQIYWHHYDHTTRRLTSRQALGSAARIELRDPHGLGYWHYWARRDYESALREFGAALRSSRATASCSRRWDTWSGAVTGRIARLRRALRYDPRSGTQLTWEINTSRCGCSGRPTITSSAPPRSLPTGPTLSLRAGSVIWRGDMTRARAIVGRGLNRSRAGASPSLHTGDQVSASIVTADSTFWPMLDGLSWALGAIRRATACSRRGPPASRGDRARRRNFGELIIEGPRTTGRAAASAARIFPYRAPSRCAPGALSRALPVADAVSGPFILTCLAPL